MKYTVNVPATKQIAECSYTVEFTQRGDSMGKAALVEYNEIRQIYQLKPIGRMPKGTTYTRLGTEERVVRTLRELRAIPAAEVRRAISHMEVTEGEQTLSMIARILKSKEGNK